MLEPGSVIAGKLRVERVLGKGGMGTVVVATHVGLDQQVAVKVLHPELANDPEVRKRFEREARAAARLKSEHVCRVNDVSALETGEPYIEMELLDGDDLSKLIELAPLSPEVASEYVLQACVAVAEAHQLGIVHRDLKPANLFVTRRLDGSPLIKVLDFGIATAPGTTELKITKTTAVMGSPGYMSPEHLRSARDVDVRSDIWSLGVILYEAVSQRLPFMANTITELAVKVVMDEPAMLTNVDPRFAAVVMRCLEKAPEKRYQTVGDLARDLVTFASPAARATADLVAKLAGTSALIPVPPVSSTSASLATPSAPISGRVSAAAPVGFAATMPPAEVEVRKVHETTLGRATGETTGESSTAPKRRRPALLAAIGLVIAGGAIAATAVVMSGGHAKHARHIDAAVAVAPADAPGSNAAIVASGSAGSAKDPHEELVKLAAENDWKAIVTIGDASDPLVVEARPKYVAQATQKVDAAVHDGNCDKAKDTADEAGELVPDVKDALVAKAAACKPHVASAKEPAKPTAKEPTKPPAEKPLKDPTTMPVDSREQVRADLAAANSQLASNPRKALEMARAILKPYPKNKGALRILGLAGCRLKQADAIDEALDTLPPMSLQSREIRSCAHRR